MSKDQIKALRLRLGLTQDKFAALIGLEGRSMVCRLERGSRKPTGTMTVLLKRIESETLSK